MHDCKGHPTCPNRPRTSSRHLLRPIDRKSSIVSKSDVQSDRQRTYSKSITLFLHSNVTLLTSAVLSHTIPCFPSILFQLLFSIAIMQKLRESSFRSHKDLTRKASHWRSLNCEGCLFDQPVQLTSPWVLVAPPSTNHFYRPLMILCYG